MMLLCDSLKNSAINKLSSKFQFDREFEGHRFVSRETVYVLPSLNIVDLFIYE